MNDRTYNYKDLPPDMVNWTVPLKIQVLMSGVQHAKQFKNGDVELTYTDGTTETAPCPEIEIIDEDNFFKIISSVQGKRKESPDAKS